MPHLLPDEDTLKPPLDSAPRPLFHTQHTNGPNLKLRSFDLTCIQNTRHKVFFCLVLFFPHGQTQLHKKSLLGVKDGGEEEEQRKQRM